MRVIATQGDHEVEATLARDGTRVTVTIGDREHVFTVERSESGRLELAHASGLHVVELDGTDLRVDGVPYPLQLRKAPPNVPGATRGAGGAGGATKVKPPMPGKIVNVAVQAGDHVQAGDLLVVLEAMKMQNEIVAPAEGTIKAVHVAEGDNIDAKKIMLEIE